MFIIVKVTSHGGKLKPNQLVLANTDENKKEGDEAWFENPISSGWSLGKIITVLNKTEQKKLLKNV
jgi:hypothetical protein